MSFGKNSGGRLGDDLKGPISGPSMGWPKFVGLPGDFVSLGMMQRTKWGWVERKLVINLFRFSCGRKSKREK